MSTSKEIQLKSLYLSRCASYGPTPDQFEGEVTFESDMGQIKLHVDAALSKDILRLVADNMARATQELANKMTASIFDQDLTPQLPAEVAGVTTAAINPDDDFLY